MAKFPEPPPPSSLAAIAPAVHLLAAATALWRVYFRGGQYPTTWQSFRAYGPIPSARFDHHQPPPHPQQKAILYAAGSGPVCVAEVFQAQRLIDRVAREPWLVAFSLVRDVPLLDMCGTWPTMAGASMAIASGPRGRARRWSAAIHAAYPDIEGIWYPSSMHGNEPAVALYERARDALPSTPFFHEALATPALFAPLVQVARRLGYRIR